MLQVFTYEPPLEDNKRLMKKKLNETLSEAFNFK